MMSDLGSKKVLIVGLGGLGCPAALALARAGIGELVLCDDDIVDVTNLHRQILYRETDVGRDKLTAGREALLGEASSTKISLRRTRLLPTTARALVAESDLVVEGADNFATKFLAADAAFLEEKPIVHGAAVRMHGTAWSVGARGKPCYRCLFEDLLPAADAPNCSEAGVAGPLVGLVGAYMADLALSRLQDDDSRETRITSFDGTSLKVRDVSVSSRPDCALCGTHPSPILDTPLSLYQEPQACSPSHA